MLLALFGAANNRSNLRNGSAEFGILRQPLLVFFVGHVLDRGVPFFRGNVMVAYERNGQLVVIGDVSGVRSNGVDARDWDIEFRPRSDEGRGGRDGVAELLDRDGLVRTRIRRVFVLETVVRVPDHRNFIVHVESRRCMGSRGS